MSPSAELRPSVPADLQVVSACRSCGSAQLEDVLSLGSTPLANSLLTASAVEPSRYPLDLARCQGCTLVQLKQIVSPQRLFSDYIYYSSFSETMVEHAAQLAEGFIEAEGLGDGSLVVEIASNDGYLLQFFKQKGVRVLGIEPAQNIARFAEEERGIPTRVEFFDERLAADLVAAGQQADVIVGNNVLAHVPDLNGFVAGVRLLLSRDGTASFEVPYLKDMLDGVEFDTIYHEHQSYFSLTALSRLFRTHGLDVWDARRIPIHGGSIRVSVCHRGRRPSTPAVADLITGEQAWGVATQEPYLRFARAVGTLRLELLQLLEQLRAKTGPLAAYGAAAKGVTLLSYCGVGAEYLDFVVDRSTYKQGKRYPVDALPIYAPSALVETRRAHTLLLTWNFAAEILRQQDSYVRMGGKFVVPVPTPRVVPTHD